ncbi:type VI secretion system baseplate subunit TssG [Aureliella helgolandensis]|uniref:Type VI secretion system baseplate subunit TssG n=1 Tax=Aureliella helgolandensis TaxID=2527968 RepID=A0A518G558_9BACT|nr:type VI secretion system baseplate subunit TssG [Aureliella helgolandensis]QDV23700.1 hypothetical protein Q31a_20050 [Aureliella helgolandensis]
MDNPIPSISPSLLNATPFSTSGIALANRRTPPKTIAQALFEDGCDFDFFQAAMLLETIYPERKRIGEVSEFGKPAAVKFAAHSTSLGFASSAIHCISPATTEQPLAKMTVGFMGLTGPAGILPDHYTELLRRIEIESRSAQKHALRDWLDLFNNRIIALFYSSWKKYRPYTSFHQALQPVGQHETVDRFTQILQSTFGVGLPAVSRQISHFSLPRTQPTITDVIAAEQPTGTPTTTVRQSLLRYCGLLSQRPRTAANLQALLEDYFELPTQVLQLQGNWLSIDEEAQTQLGVLGGNCVLAENAVIGNQTWERQNKIVVRIGPLTWQQFCDLIPDRESAPHKNQFELLSELTRLFVGPEFDFEFQMTLAGDEVPECQVSDDDQAGLRLGWNTWLPSDEQVELVDDATFVEAA